MPTVVLVTGATGEVGRAIVPTLEQHFDVRLLSAEPSSGPSVINADICRLDAGLLSAFHGVDAVVHLAVAGGHAGTYEDDAFNARRFDVNVKGTWHVFEAARRAGVRRVVHTSSLMTLWGHAHPSRRTNATTGCAPPDLTNTLVPGDAPARPVGTYALTKALSEQIARYGAEAFGMEVITLRIAAPLNPEEPRWKQEPVPPQRIPVSELARAYRLALTVPLARYEVVTLVGESSRRIWDLGAAKRVLGYVPELCLDELGLTLGDPFATVPSDAYVRG